jgi:lipopolysaccharide/colanic/teichoic acid biosynthesis glycosyltransferase
MQQTTITNPQTGRESAKQHYTVITYLYQSREQAGTASLYKTLRKNFTKAGKPEIFSKRLPLDQWQHRFIKRAIDILLSLLVLIVILPWLAPIMAIFIKL